VVINRGPLSKVIQSPREPGRFGEQAFVIVTQFIKARHDRFSG
jgi:hypothetical protein